MRRLPVILIAGSCLLLGAALFNARGAGPARDGDFRAHPDEETDRGPTAGGRDHPRRHHPPPPGPLMMTLDFDMDGELSAEEIATAAEALLELDVDGDGHLSHDELRPPPPPAWDRPGEDRDEDAEARPRRRPGRREGERRSPDGHSGRRGRRGPPPPDGP